AVGFSFDRLFFEIVPFVDGRFSLADPDLYFHPAIFPVEPERDECLALNRAGRKQLGNLRLVEQEFASAFRFVLSMASAEIRLNIRIVEVNLVIFDPREGIVKVGKAGPDGFNLRSLKFNARLYLFEDLVIVKRAAVGNDLGGHMSLPREDVLNFSRRFGLKLIGEFAVNNLFQCDVGVGHPWTHFDQWPVPHGQLAHTLRYEIHQQSGVRNDFRRFLKELAGHSYVCPAHGRSPMAQGGGRWGWNVCLSSGFEPEPKTVKV
ncbi:MAG: hypothetical protein QOI53_4675, partial [Verrucomicrobiota bacterium]|nr:hypothetical protein [Verrucomicrobiota bacterium]